MLDAAWTARVRLVEAASGTGRARWIARPDARTAERYATAVAAVAPRIEARLDRAVVANRVAALTTDPLGLRLESWRTARARFRSAVRGLANEAVAVVAADVRDCYGSIAATEVAERLRRWACPAGSVEAVDRALQAFRRAGVCGLPVGPDPSAVLANAVLSSIDEALRDAGLAHVRWVDDVLVFLTDPSGCSDALEVLASSLGSVGLRLAEHKTRTGDPAAVLGERFASVSGPPLRPSR